MIRLDHVTKHFNGGVVIDDVSLTVPPGQTVVLIGPSGSGKSTLLSLIVGLITPDTGSVTIAGETLTPQTAPNLRRNMGYVIQDGGLFPHMTALENIALMAREAGWPAEKRRERIDTLCSLTRFPASGLTRYPVELSGGQRQRVSLMRALMLEPGILLMDEPLGALDPMIRADLQDDLKAIFTELRSTVVFVTHDLSEAAFFGETIVLLHQGKIIQQGQFRDLAQRPVDDFVRRFVQAQRKRLEGLGL